MPDVVGNGAEVIHHFTERCTCDCRVLSLACWRPEVVISGHQWSSVAVAVKVGWVDEWMMGGESKEGGERRDVGGEE